MGIAGNLWILPRGTVEEAESCPLALLQLHFFFKECQVFLIHVGFGRLPYQTGPYIKREKRFAASGRIAWRHVSL